jgi:single-strand DNA-binding protein
MAWNETRLTLVGWICTPIKLIPTAGGTAMATFSMVANERRFDQATGTWNTADSVFVRVRCFRRLAENLAVTLDRGDPVVVTGRVHTSRYEVDGQTRSDLEMDAVAIGPDLSLCKLDMRREAGAEQPAEAVAA